VSINRYAARRDGNEDEICDALESLGFHVDCVSEPGIPDLILSRAGHWYVAECKVGKRRETKSQVSFRKRSRAPIPIFRDVGDVVDWEKGLPR
jgi:hypothetical protein